MPYIDRNPNDLLAAMCKDGLPVSALKVGGLFTIRRNDEAAERRRVEAHIEATRSRMVIMRLLGSLVWDYADTVLDMAVLLSPSETRPVSRKIRELRASYDRFSISKFTADDYEKVKRAAETFTSEHAELFARLSYGLDNEIKRYDLRYDWGMLVKSVQMAMTVYDAMRLFDRDTSGWFTSIGVPTITVMPEHITRLSRLLPEFAGDCYDAESESRRLTAKAIYGELKRDLNTLPQ